MPADHLSIHQTIADDGAGQTVLSWLRNSLPDCSWTQCRQVLAARRVSINGVVTIHEGRRLAGGDVVDLSASGSPLPRADRLPLIYLDQDIVVVDKPPHVVSTRHREELQWPLSKRLLEPSLDELTAVVILQRESRAAAPIAIKHLKTLPRLWRVQRLDRQTSGLLVFARTPAAAEKLIGQFSAHSVERCYRAVVHGQPTAQTIETRLVRDRGDGRRGSSPDGHGGQRAVTHITSVTPRGRYSLIECRLETGRTHQIRIHLAELGHPVCGDDRYGSASAASPDAAPSRVPRLALHAASLAFEHPRTGERLSFASEWPQDLAEWLAT